jgi:uncharacterized protein (TIGR02246 family)
MRRQIFWTLLLGSVGVLSTVPARAQNAARPADDEQAIRKDVEQYAEAYNKGDIDAAGSHWTDDAEYINDEGKSTKGRESIVSLFKRGRVARKGYKFNVQVQSVRILKSDVALEDGTVILTAPDGTAEKNRFTAVLLKGDGKWRISRVQDLPSLAESDEPTPAQKLKQLEWLVGQWQDEEKDTDIRMTCRWAPGKSFLIQEYVIKRPNHETLEISQRIGWDPVNDQLRSWIFDSRGGYSDGAWQRSGNEWSVAVSGVLPDGHQASARQVWSFVDDKHFKWQAVDREVDSRPLTDSTVKFRRVEDNQTAAAETNAAATKAP